MKKTLVAYFSASGVTAKLAAELAEMTGSDLYEIQPAVKYTPEDLDWRNSKSRSSVEMKDKQFRPALGGEEADIAAYDTIYLGFPIWWYVAPTIVNTFLEKYDFSGKTIILFGTAGSSNFGDTVKELKVSVAPDTVIKEGRVFHGRNMSADLKKWLGEQ